MREIPSGSKSVRIYSVKVIFYKGEALARYHLVAKVLVSLRKSDGFMMGEPR